MKRSTGLGVGLAAIVTAAASGGVAGRSIRSPSEVAARTAPPKPSAITVAVERVSLSSAVTTRGTVQFGAPRGVFVAASPLKASTSGASAVITALPTTGATLVEGSSAFSLSGRPVLVLTGAVPSHRDLVVGTVGDDVRQLEAALARLGFSPGPVDGTYDHATALAVAAWYRSAGWTPFGPTDEQNKTMRAAQADAATADADQVGAAEAAVTAASSLRIARDHLAAAHGVAGAAPTAAASARRRAEAEQRVAGAEVVAKTAAVQSAREAAQIAKLKLADAMKAPPESAPSRAERAALESAVAETDRNIGVAQAQLTAAEAVAAASKDGPAQVVDPAIEVAGALADIASAEAMLALTKSRERTTATRAAVTLAAVPMTADVQVPSDEILFLANLPARVDEVKAKVGEPPTGPVLSVTSQVLAIDAALSIEDAQLVRVGAAVAISAPDLGVTGTGTVSDVATTPGTNGVDPQRIHIGVTPASLPPSLVGGGVVLTITVTSTGGPVLAIPASALSIGGDGTSRVSVVARDGSSRFVRVTPGLGAQGLVAVTPTSGDLSPGDLVIVGTKPAAGP